MGLGIGFVLWVARLIATAPGATLHVDEFAPWAIVFLTLAVLSAVIWRSALFRLSAVPLALLGIAGAMAGEKFDLAIPPAGDIVAVRAAGGRFDIIGKHNDLFAVEQWLAAAGDPRPAAAATIGPRRPAADPQAPRCDRLGCVAELADGRRLSLVLDAEAFLEDCVRADIIVTPLAAPSTCGAELVIDRRKLAATGAVTLTLAEENILLRSARAPEEDRPWSRPPAQEASRRSTDPPTASAAEEAAASVWQNTPLDQ
jgi:competence protein ComEC